MNADGGINGAELTFETFDDASDAAQSTNMAQIVTSDEKYIAAIGSYTSTCALAFGLSLIHIFPRSLRKSPRRAKFKKCIIGCRKTEQRSARRKRRVTR